MHCSRTDTLDDASTGSVRRSTSAASCTAVPIRADGWSPILFNAGRSVSKTYRSLHAMKTPSLEGLAGLVRSTHKVLSMFDLAADARHWKNLPLQRTAHAALDRSPAITSPIRLESSKVLANSTWCPSRHKPSISGFFSATASWSQKG